MGVRCCGGDAKDGAEDRDGAILHAEHDGADRGDERAGTVAGRSAGESSSVAVPEAITSRSWFRPSSCRPVQRRSLPGDKKLLPTGLSPSAIRSRVPRFGLPFRVARFVSLSLSKPGGPAFTVPRVPGPSGKARPARRRAAERRSRASGWSARRFRFVVCHEHGTTC